MPAENFETHMPISEARKLLAELVQRAAYQGREFTITRNGKPMAKIVPIDKRRIVAKSRF